MKETLSVVLALACAAGCASEAPRHPVAAGPAGADSRVAAVPAPPTSSAPVAAPPAPSAVTTPAPSASVTPPTDDAKRPCAEGGIADCDALADRWSPVDMLRHDTGAARDAAAMKRGCDEHRISSACLGYALMLKYGQATGTRDGAGARPYFDRLPGLGDLNGFRGEKKTPEGERALAATLTACDQGRARACGQIGWAAYNGFQRGKDLRDAYAFYKKSCTLGSKPACRWAGHFAVTYPESGGTDGHALLERACHELAIGGACEDLGAELEEAGRDPEKAVALYKKGCDLGDRAACARQGIVLLAKKGRQAEAKSILQGACDAGEDLACKALKRP